MKNNNYYNKNDKASIENFIKFRAENFDPTYDDIAHDASIDLANLESKLAN